MVIEGVRMLRLANMSSSRSRGTPSVTLPAPWPAKWKVLSVICVDGSPMPCAASTPTACAQREPRRNAPPPTHLPGRDEALQVLDVHEALQLLALGRVQPGGAEPVQLGLQALRDAPQVRRGRVREHGRVRLSADHHQAPPAVLAASRA